MVTGPLRPVADFIANWHPKPLGPDDGLDPSRAPIPIPSVLAAWYRLAGERFLCTRDDYRFERPYQLKVTDGFLLVFSEGQGAGSFGFRESDLQPDDPPVVEETTPSRIEAPTFSSFLRAILVSDLFPLGGPNDPNPRRDGPVRHGLLTGTHLRTLFEMTFGRLDLPLWHPWTAATEERIALLGNDETLIRVKLDCWAWVATRTQEAEARLSGLVECRTTWVSDLHAYSDAINP